MAAEALSQLGISKAISISSTYDHRVIQGGGGAFLARVHQFLIGKDQFYNGIFSDLGIPYPPLIWNQDRNPFFLSADQEREQTIKEARHRTHQCLPVRGHLIADMIRCTRCRFFIIRVGHRNVRSNNLGS
jgi:2-oxoglutarate dehydrogenase E1 component